MTAQGGGKAQGGGLLMGGMVWMISLTKKNSPGETKAGKEAWKK